MINLDVCFQSTQLFLSLVDDICDYLSEYVVGSMRPKIFFSYILACLPGNVASYREIRVHFSSFIFLDVFAWFLSSAL